MTILTHKIQKLDRRMSGTGIFQFRVAFRDCDYRSHSFKSGVSGGEWWKDRIRDYVSAVTWLTERYGTGFPLDHSGVIRKDQAATPAWCFQPNRQNDYHGYTIYLRDETVKQDFEAWQAWRILELS